MPAPVEFERAAGATISMVSSAATSTPLLAWNPQRRMVILYNSDANALLLKYGENAAGDSFTYRIGSGGTWEMPVPIYIGPIDGIWEANGSGVAMITEVTV